MNHHPFELQTSSMTPATQAADVIAAGPGAVAERLKLDRAQVAELERAEVERKGDFFRLAHWHGSVTVERTGRREFTATARGPSVRGWTKIFRDRTADYAWMAAKAELVAYLERLREGSLADARERIALLTAETEALLPFDPPADMESWPDRPVPRSIDTVDLLASLRDRLDVMLADLAELDEQLANRSFVEHQCSPQGIRVSTEWWSVDKVTRLANLTRARVSREIARIEEVKRIIDEEDEAW